jgi:hypothetical protein
MDRLLNEMTHLQVNSSRMTKIQGRKFQDCNSLKLKINANRGITNCSSILEITCKINLD